MTSASSDNSRGPLSGVRVVDLTTTFMGPYCTAQMARMGADVIKVEEPLGDVTRGINDRHRTGLGPIFIAGNHGKRSIALDLKDPRGRDALLVLVKQADVLVHNMRPQAVAKLGIGPDEIHETNPACVYAALTGFGASGRYADLAAYDDVIQAVSGMASIQATSDGFPAYIKSAIADKTVGLMALGAITAALFDRSRTGKGATVTVPMMESMVSFNLLEQQGDWIYDPPQGTTGYTRLSSPYRRPYATADGHLGVVVYTDRMWSAFFELIGSPELAEEPRFLTIAERTANIDELYALVERELLKHPSDYWQEQLAARGIPVVAVRTVEDLFSDEHLSDVQFFNSYEHPVAGKLKLPRHPIEFDGDPEPVGRPAPLLGQHSVEVLLEAGLLAEDVEALLVAGITKQSVVIEESTNT